MNRTSRKRGIIERCEYKDGPSPTAQYTVTQGFRGSKSRTQGYGTRYPHAPTVQNVKGVVGRWGDGTLLFGESKTQGTEVLPPTEQVLRP